MEINPDEIEYSRIEGEKFKESLANSFNFNEDEFITISGFAFKHKDFKDDEISISRLPMTCGADTSVMALKSHISNLSEKIEIGAWYTFIGKAKKTQIFDETQKKYTDVPLLIVKNAQRIETPISPYGYP